MTYTVLSFLQLMDSHFRYYGMTDEESQITYATNCFPFDSNAQHWWADFQTNRPTTWDRFVEELKCQYIGPNHLLFVQHAYRRLRQTGDISKYIHQFQSMARQLGINLEHPNTREQAFDFVRGLKQELQTTIMAQGLHITSYPQVRDHAKRLASNMDLSTITNKDSPSLPFPSPSTYKPNSVASKPAQSSASSSKKLNAVVTKPEAKFHHSPATNHRKKLTQEEKDLRRANNQCIVCGDPSHPTEECPIRKNPNAGN